MLYLENKLSGEEIHRLNAFAKSLGSSLPGLCDTSATAQIGEFILDVVKLDDLVAKNVPEYDPVECLYVGDFVSCADVIRIVHGSDIEAILQKLVRQTTERKDKR